MDSSAIDKHNRKAARQRHVFSATFSSGPGAEVLAALKEEFYDCPVSPEDNLAFKAGERNVVYRILEMMETK